MTALKRISYTWGAPGIRLTSISKHYRTTILNEKMWLSDHLRVHLASAIYIQCIWKKTWIRGSNLIRLAKAFCGGDCRPRRIFKSQRVLYLKSKQMELLIPKLITNQIHVQYQMQITCWHHWSIRTLKFKEENLGAFTCYQNSNKSFKLWWFFAPQASPSPCS